MTNLVIYVVVLNYGVSRFELIYCRIFLADQFLFSYIVISNFDKDRPEMSQFKIGTFGWIFGRPSRDERFNKKSGKQFGG